MIGRKNIFKILDGLLVHDYELLLIGGKLKVRLTGNAKVVRVIILYAFYFVTLKIATNGDDFVIV